MDSLDTNTLIAVIAAGVVVVAIIAALAWNAYQTNRLKSRFGPEYDAVLRRTGNKAKAEKELRQREARVEKFQIVPLSPTDTAKFSTN